MIVNVQSSVSIKVSIDNGQVRHVFNSLVLRCKGRTNVSETNVIVNVRHNGRLIFAVIQLDAKHSHVAHQVANYLDYLWEYPVEIDDKN
jgi:hypothetical protein